MTFASASSHKVFGQGFGGKLQAPLATSGSGRRRACVTSALLCVLSGLALQSLVVNFRYGGNWTALFYTGSNFKVPPALAGERVYVFPNSTGYDGQMYHYVAHDPLIRTDIWRYMDNSRVRYRRILLPAIAFLLAAGRQAWIDPALFGAKENWPACERTGYCFRLPSRRGFAPSRSRGRTHTSVFALGDIVRQDLDGDRAVEPSVLSTLGRTG